MSRGTEALLILGAIGSFLVGILVIPEFAVAIGLFVMGQFGPEMAGLIIRAFALMLGGILMGIGFLGLWRKSGNFITLVSAIFLFLTSIGYLYTAIYPFLPIYWNIPNLEGLVSIIMGAAWFSAGISAWILRDEFSRFAIVAALVFVITAAASPAVVLLFGLLGAPIWFAWLIALTGIVMGIFFLDAIRIET